MWLIHQHRTAYELWDHPEYGDLATYPEGPAVRDLIRASDRLALGEAERIFTNSENVKGRLERSMGLPGEVLYHRSRLTERLLEAPPDPSVTTSCSPAGSTGSNGRASRWTRCAM